MRTRRAGAKIGFNGDDSGATGKILPRLLRLGTVANFAIAQTQETEKVIGNAELYEMMLV